MIRIFFQYEEDARNIYEMLVARQSALLYSHKSFELKESQLLISTSPESHNYIINQLVVPVIADFILRCKEETIIMEILQEKFLYNDPEEKSQIFQVVQSIIEGERKGVPQKAFNQTRDSLISQSLQNFLSVDITFSFESFVRFRLKEYVKRLLYYVELGIDDYKMEQDHQILLEHLRELILKQKPKVCRVHLLFSEEILFYDECFKEITKEERERYCQELTVYHRNLYIDENVIKPLLAIAPSQIYIYTAQPEQSLVYTVQNIFQEKVKVRLVRDFFSLYANK